MEPQREGVGRSWASGRVPPGLPCPGPVPRSTQPRVCRASMATSFCLNVPKGPAGTGSL